ncbi:hypothetical protein [Streptomyces sp. RTd22]|uniref:hypothetical protein n=1 Tax=Streptomyces sp. RTd22 TaxID=1841249 RepID=UPI0007C5543C|nr:hypothetical protein [Streptomyces sp. RTd22]
MANQPSSQLTPATALVQILKEHPDLPEALWTVNGATLNGHVYGPNVGNFDALRAYAETFGGSIRPRHSYDLDGQTLRVHELTARWRDVRLVVAVSVPEGMRDPQMLDGLLAEQRHLMDPEAPESWGVTA